MQSDTRRQHDGLGRLRRAGCAHTEASRFGIGIGKLVERSKIIGSVKCDPFFLSFVCAR